ncbi:MAG: ATP-binding protein [Labilithrix sp.]|nr:ATP-binding protein [Labilithrix sp.]MBX3224893.1 ATP-binding protein [Labilithrix sp.]
MKDAELFANALGPENGTSYRVSRAVATAFPDKVAVELSETFDLEDYAEARLCEASLRSSPHAVESSHWRRAYGLSRNVSLGVWDVKWSDHDLVVVRAAWPDRYTEVTRYYILAETRAIAEGFGAAVCAYCNEPHRTVLAFRGGCWRRDREIHQTIQSASFDDLVLAGDMAREIREDFTSFLGAKDAYARYGVPWKRGVLFLGPPGNGKTHCLRAVIKLLDVPCLYVQSLRAHYETDDANIARVFERARELTPCCLVFEDLDSMITAENRSTFLNQLDGFANASGMLTLATTNHPEKLDPAILDRPSRFDRKYHFGLPAPAERARYVARWRERLDSAMAISDEEAELLTTKTDGFSFAYLKELFLSAMIRWMSTQQPGAMFAQLQSQLETLCEQMRTEPNPTPAALPVEPRFPFT